MRRTVKTAPTSASPNCASALAGVLVAGAILAFAGCGGSADTQATNGPSTIAFQWLPGDRDGDAVWLTDEDGGERRRLLPDGAPASTIHPDWSHDGVRLAFEGEGAAGNDLWVANADGSEARRVLEARVGCEARTCYLTYPAWSPDDRSLAFVRFAEAEDGATTGRIEVVDVESGERRVVWTPPARTLPNYPRWSPDGASLVFEQTRYPSAVPESGTDLGSAIAVVDVSAVPATPRVITRWDARGTYPDWSPDGETIVFTTYDLGELQGTDEPSNLFTIRPDGSDLTQLTRYPPGGKRATQPTWTPDGKRILFTLVGQSPEFDNPRQAAFVDADGSNLVVLPGSATHPRLRPGS